LHPFPRQRPGTQGYPTSFQKIVRWGQNGIALSVAASAFTSVNQIFTLQSPLVEDLSASPADLSVTLTAPATATTGTTISWVANISNNGPNQAQGATLTMNLDSSLIINSVAPSQGSCGTGSKFTCDLGSLANGASATVTVSATPSTSGTLAGGCNALVHQLRSDNNQQLGHHKYRRVGKPVWRGAVLTSSSSSSITHGSGNTLLTLTGSNFLPGVAVTWNGSYRTTTWVSSTNVTVAILQAIWPAPELHRWRQQTRGRLVQIRCDRD
jgi:uncharacterized repeat protein (TIGR01451 family)